MTQLGQQPREFLTGAIDRIEHPQWFYPNNFPQKHVYVL